MVPRTLELRAIALTVLSGKTIERRAFSSPRLENDCEVELCDTILVCMLEPVFRDWTWHGLVGGLLIFSSRILTFRHSLNSKSRMLLL